jgi:hypothetical protein
MVSKADYGENAYSLLQCILQMRDINGRALDAKRPSFERRFASSLIPLHPDGP